MSRPTLSSGALSAGLQARCFRYLGQVRIFDIQYCETLDFFTETEKSRSVAITQNRTPEPQVRVQNTLRNNLPLQQLERHKATSMQSGERLKSRTKLLLAQEVSSTVVHNPKRLFA